MNATSPCVSQWNKGNLEGDSNNYKSLGAFFQALLRVILYMSSHVCERLNPFSELKPTVV